ncbi:MAG: flagellar hook-basal body complex protein FliE [Devosiaceae bacterium]|nr:flagellar hook-basal body complex protein FliE [Devosiaceae bacterium]
MSITFNAATSAYGQAQKLISSAGEQGKLDANPVSGEGGGFAQALQDNLSSIVESGKVADATSMEMINGGGNVVDVVTAIAEAEIAIESMVTIRDRVIKAYEEIMRMPI